MISTDGIMCSNSKWLGKKQSKETILKAKRFQFKIQLGRRPEDSLSREAARS